VASDAHDRNASGAQGYPPPDRETVFPGKDVSSVPSNISFGDHHKRR
jgi:hypothetical protein